MFSAVSTQKDLLIIGMNGTRLRSEAGVCIIWKDRDELSISADTSSHWGLLARDLA